MHKPALLFALIVTVAFAAAVHADDLAHYFGAGGSALIGLLVGGSAVSSSNPIPVTSSDVASVSQGNITSICGSVPNSSTTVTLSAPSKTIDFYTSSDASVVHINWANGTATTSNAAIYPGSSYRYQGTAISAFKIDGEGTNGSYNVIAK